MNDILNTQIETIFDYDLSNEEAKILACGIDREKYIELSSIDTINKGLMMLFAMRGNADRSNHYKNKLPTDFVKHNLNWDLVQ